MRKIFNHLDISLSYQDLIAETSNSGRVYSTPTGNKYPSITTALGYRDKWKWAQWRASIGEEEAKRITRHATTRGTSLHNIAERYINNEDEYVKTPGEKMPHVQQSWKVLQNVIDSRINNVHMQECPLYSDTLRVAGRVDCIAEFDGKLSIIDFKTSSKVKDRDDIHSYFMQECAYAIMYEEQTGTPIDQLITIMIVDGSSTPVIFVEKKEDWIDKLIDEITYFYENNNV